MIFSIKQTLGLIAILLSTLSSLWLTYFWFIQSAQHSGAKMALGIGWIFVLFLQMISIGIFIFGEKSHHLFSAFVVSLILFLVLSIYLILFV